MNNPLFAVAQQIADAKKAGINASIVLASALHRAHLSPDFVLYVGAVMYITAEQYNIFTADSTTTTRTINGRTYSASKYETSGPGSFYGLTFLY